MLRLTFALLIALLLTSTPVSGQSTQLGVVGGFIWATYGAESETFDPGPLDPRVGRMGGVALRLELTPVWTLELGSLYLQKGFKKAPNYRMRVDYIEVPLLVRARLPFVPGPAWLELHTGVAPARELRSRQSYVPLPGEGSFPSRPPSRQWDLGAVGGGGLGLERGGLTLLVEARYSRGLMDLFPDQESGSARNRAWALIMTTAFPVF